MRNGAPFKHWVLPRAIEKVCVRLRGVADGDRQMVEILAAAMTDGLAAVEPACAEALDNGVHSADVAINILARRRDPEPSAPIATPETLQELGRVARTLLTLDWLDDPALRRQATVELNKGEARNALARAACLNRPGSVRGRTPGGPQHRAGGLTPVTAAIVLWSTVKSAEVIDVLRAEGEAIPDAIPPLLSPLGWQHINLIGDFIWAAGSASPEAGNTLSESEGTSAAA